MHALQMRGASSCGRSLPQLKVEPMNDNMHPIHAAHLVAELERSILGSGSAASEPPLPPGAGSLVGTPDGAEDVPGVPEPPD
jgi:hypothetical protein